MRVRELRVTYSPSNRTPTWPKSKPCTHPSDAAAILLPILQQEPQEVFGVLLLDTKHRLLGWHEVHRGTIDNVTVIARDVFRVAILMNARGVILAHNHPSGDATPSADDLHTTSRMVAAGELLDVQVLDHLIIGDGVFCSFRDTGRL